VAFAAAAPFQPYLVQHLRFRMLLVLGSLLFSLYIAMGLVLSALDEITWPFELLFAGSAAGKGLGAAMIWSGQAGYLKLLLPPAEEGRYTSLFWAVLQTSYLWGNLIGVILLKLFNHQIYILALLTLTLISAAAHLFLL
jgi:hypothetical protein